MKLTTAEFLKYFTGTIFQTYYDPDSTKGNTPSFTSFDPDEFARLQKEEYGIFLSVNAFEGRRTEDHLTKLNALYCDMDAGKEGTIDTPEEITKRKRVFWQELEKLPIPPNIITVTKNGLQPLWLIEDPGTDPETRADYVSTLQGIIEWSKEFGAKGDRVKDIPRVLRLPGYLHQKSAPFMIESYLLHEKKTTLGEMKKLFPYFDPTQIINDFAKDSRDLTELDKLPIEDVALHALSAAGHPEAHFDRKNRIVLARGVTGAFIGKHDDRQYIGSNSHELPSGNKITFVRNLLNLPDNRAAYAWIRKEFNLQSYKAPTPTSVSTPVKPLRLAEVGKLRNADKLLEIDAPKTGFPKLDELVVGFLPKHFWTLTGETNVGKTALACNFADFVRQQKKKVLYVALEPDYRVADYLASIREGKEFKELTPEDLLFDDGLIDVLTLDEVPTYQDLLKVVRESSEKYAVVIIDHIGYFCDSGTGDSFLQEQAATIRSLAGLSKEISSCVIAIAHPRKPVSGSRNRILSLYDIAGSAAFAQDSTEVLVLYRPPLDESDLTNVQLSSNGVLMVQKSKSGDNGSVKIKFVEKSALIISHI